MKTFLHLLTLSVALSLVSTAPAQTPIFSDNFNSDSTGSVAQNPAWNDNGGGSSPPVANVVADTGNVFQQGAGNQVLQFNATTETNAGAINYSTPAAVVSLTFSLVIPSGGEYYMQFIDSSYTQIANAVIQNGLVNGVGTNFAGSPVQLTFVLNTSNSSSSYNGAQTGQTINANSLDVWEIGTRIIDGSAINGSAAANDPVDAFQFSYFASGTGDVDNVAVYNDATVGVLPAAAPEPGTWALLLSGLGVLLVWSRRLHEPS